MSGGLKKDFEIKLSRGNINYFQGDIWGLVIPHSKTINKSVFVELNHDSKEDELDTWIHETLHVARSRLSENEVKRISGDIAKVLWKVGYRLPKPKKAIKKKKG